MSAIQERAEVWTCDGCGLSIRQMSGATAELPDSWSKGDEGLFCLICRRGRAAEAALDAAGEMTQEDRAKLRRTAVLEFEVTRTPERSNGEIARSCGSSVPAVAKARERLRIPEPS